MTIQTRLTTVDDLWNMPGNGEGYELVRGELIAMPPSGFEHSALGANLLIVLNAYIRANKLGAVTGADGGYVVSRNPDSVRAPDIGFVRAARMPSGRIVKYFPGAPDLAVEIISPHDVLQEMDEKVQEFLDGGTSLIWVINPRWKTVTVIRKDTAAKALSTTDTLSGEDVVPGFLISVAAIFES